MFPYFFVIFCWKLKNNHLPSLHMLALCREKSYRLEVLKLSKLCLISRSSGICPQIISSNMLFASVFSVFQTLALVMIAFQVWQDRNHPSGNFQMRQNTACTVHSFVFILREEYHGEGEFLPVVPCHFAWGRNVKGCSKHTSFHSLLGRISS